MTDLPDASFAEIAVDLACLATREAIGVEQMEVFVARNPAPALVRTLGEARTTARRMGALAGLFRALAPREAEARAALAHLLGGSA